MNFRREIQIHPVAKPPIYLWMFIEPRRTSLIPLSVLRQSQYSLRLNSPEVQSRILNCASGRLNEEKEWRSEFEAHEMERERKAL